MMPDWIREWWQGLDTAMRWFIMVVIVVLIFFVLSTYVFLDTDYSGVGQWVQGFFN